MSESNVETYLKNVLKGYSDEKKSGFEKEVTRIMGSGLAESEVTRGVTNAALVNVDVDTPEWQFISARVLLQDLYEKAAVNRGYVVESKYGSFPSLVTLLVEKGLYTKEILDWYTLSELAEVGQLLKSERDYNFTYIGLRLLADRYLANGFKGEVYELPQERFLTIALTLMAKEPKAKRMGLIKEAYWVLSQHYATVATPTFSNAGKPNGQLSSCFIDTVDDSIDGIYLDNWDNARVSKTGGGIGVYLGKIRAKNSSIRKFEGKSSGIVPWIKNLNNTAISVDQEGKRQGAIAVYVDLWHKDVIDFLNIGTNNGDERMKARDVHPGLCVPDYFMELIEADEDGRMLNPNAPWYLFDPHEVKETMGWSLEDSYDEQDGSGTWRTRYFECIANPNLSRITVTVKEIVQAFVVAQLETGHPYMFYRDEVNRKNPNKHAGMIYCSNLCTEISQNMSASVIQDEYVDESGNIIYVRSAGDFVVCNLASINLGRAVRDDVVGRTARILVRMLDNVITMNNLPLLQAKLTNERYRAVGLGTFGWHHALAVSKVDWNSEASVSLADKLYEEIAFNAISASAELAIEKGAYPLCEGSTWETGEYFESRGYLDGTSEFDWKSLSEEIALTGIRNGYLMAPAPNSSTALLAGSTQGIDPFYDGSGMYIEEKKDFKIRVVAPDMDGETFPYYYNKSAYQVNQHITILQNAARQKHVDQSISFNLYVPKDIKAKQLVELHRRVWANKIKTSYYVHGKGNVVADECEWCQ